MATNSCQREGPFNLQVTIDTATILDDPQAAELARNLGIGPARLTGALEKLAKIALAEILDMATARENYSPSSDTLQKRLEYFVLIYYGDRLPTETEIARLFQVTPAKAKTLLTNLYATRRHVLESQRTATIKRIFASPRRVDALVIELTIPSAYIVDAIKELIEVHASGFGSIGRKRLTIDTYEISVDTFNRIASALGLPLQPLEFNA